MLSIADSGVMAGRDNVALDSAQHASTVQGEGPWLRFCRYHPTASLGSEDHPLYAVRVTYCTDHGVEIVRRMSTGGALYLDSAQLCWTLTVARDDLPGELAEVLEVLGQGVCAGLALIGIKARFRAPNDLELAGKKIGSVFLGETQGVWIAQGVVLEDVDVATQLKVLRVPKEKLNPDGIQLAAERFTTVAEQLDDRDDVDLAPSLAWGLAQVMGIAMRQMPVIASTPPVAPLQVPMVLGEDADSAFLATPGGVLRAALSLSPEGEGTRILGCTLHGNMLMRPSGLFSRLCGVLTGRHVGEMEQLVRAFFLEQDWDMLACGPDDLVRVFQMAAARRIQQKMLAMTPAQTNDLMVHDPKGGGDALAILAQVDAVLVPYCAKPVWCKFRHRDACPECGKCSVGEAYTLARERGLPVTTVRDFEHLESVLSDLRDTGARAYLGMCCSNFFLKRHHAFENAMLPAVLMDISGSNCYELGQEDLAYAGKFEAQAEIDGDMLEKVMAVVPGKKRI